MLSLTQNSDAQKAGEQSTSKDQQFPQGNEPLSFRIGLVTATKGSVQKRILKDGSKDGNHSLSVSKGIYETVALNGLHEFAKAIENIKPNQAFTLGISKLDGRLKLYTNDAYKGLINPSRAIARTKSCIQWSTGTFPLLLDHDAEPDKPDLTKDEFWNDTINVIPEMAGTGRLTTTSTSSGIYNRDTGECLRPENGHHTYILARGDVERFVEIYKARCWLKGAAFFKLANPNQSTGTSSILERFPSDVAVFSPERLVYEAGALLPPTLEQRRSAPQVIEGSVLDLDTIPDLTSEEKLIAEANRLDARSLIEEKQLQAATKAITATGHKQPRAEAKRRITLCKSGLLEPNHVLEIASGGSLRVEDIGPQHDGLLLKDPQEPDYRNGAQVAKLYWNGDRPWQIHSEAHGGCNYSAATTKCVRSEDTHTLVTDAEAEAIAIAQEREQQQLARKEATLRQKEWDKAFAHADSERQRIETILSDRRSASAAADANITGIKEASKVECSKLRAAREQNLQFVRQGLAKVRDAAKASARNTAKSQQKIIGFDAAKAEKETAIQAAIATFESAVDTEKAKQYKYTAELIAEVETQRDADIAAVRNECTSGCAASLITPILIQEQRGCFPTVVITDSLTTITVSGFYSLYTTASQPEGGKERALSTELMQLLTPGRRVYLHIPDEQVIVPKITGSRIVFGGLLAASGCDVFVTGTGKNLKDQSKRLDRWRKAQFAQLDRLKYPDLYELTGDRTQDDSQYLSINDLSPGFILWMSADCGRGKTTAMKQFLLKLFGACKDAQVEDIGYRISLGQQKVEIFNEAFATQQTESGETMPLIVHLGDADRSDEYDAQVVSYPIDSLLRRVIAIKRAIAAGRRVIILFDENDAVMKHLVMGGTLKGRQAKVWQELSELLPEVLASGGNIIGGEANLTQVSIDAVTALAKAKPEQVIIIENTLKATKRNVYSHSAIDDEGAASDNLLRRLAAIDCLRALRGEDIRKAPELQTPAQIIEQLGEPGQKHRVLFATTSQANAQRVEQMAIAEGYKAERHDGKTANEAYSKAFRTNPDSRLEAHKPDLVILTHSLESGVSIDIKGYFDLVIVDGDRLESRALLQFSMRVREPLDIHLYVNERALFAEFNQETDPDAILKEFGTYGNDCRGFSRVDDVLGPDVVSAAIARSQEGAGALLHSFRAKYEARLNQSSANLREHTLINFRNAGHSVVELAEGAIEGAYSPDDIASYKKASSEVIDAETQVYVSQLGDLPPKQARKVLRSGKATYSERVNAIKSLDKDAFPALVIESEGQQVAAFDCIKFVESEIIKGNRALLRAHTLSWHQKNQKIARKLDLNSWEKQCSAPFPVLPAIRNNSAKLGIEGQDNEQTYNLAALVVELGEGGRNAYNDDKVLLIARIARRNRVVINRHLRIKITENTPPEIIANKLTRKFGFKSSRESYQTTELGDRRWIYKLEPQEHQQAVWDSLDRKWSETLATEEKEVEIKEPSLQIRQKEKSVYENVTPPPRVPIPIPKKADIPVVTTAWITQSADPLAADYYDSSAWGWKS